MADRASRKPRAASAKMRPWRRILDAPMGDLEVTETGAQITNGTIIVRIKGPEDEVEPMVDRFLREWT